MELPAFEPLGDDVAAKEQATEEDVRAFFLREAAVVADVVRQLAVVGSSSSSAAVNGGFDDILYVTCQAFLRAHDTGLSARRGVRQELQKRAENASDARRDRDSGPFLTRLGRFLEDPTSSKQSAAFFVVIALLVVVSCVATITSTLPAYNPLVTPDYLTTWNSVELTLGGIFTIELGLRFAASVFDAALPTSVWQNTVRFFTKVPNLVDIISILPTYVQLFVPPTSRVITGTLRTVRLLRLFKILRVYKPVRVLQKALRFAGRGLVAPLLFLFTTLVFISAGVYYAEHGEYVMSRRQFLLNEDPVCIFEPAYFMPLSQRMPGFVYNVSSPPLTTAAPIWLTLPPEGDSSSSSDMLGSSDDAAHDTTASVINLLQCPVSEAWFVEIAQASWWAIVTMSTCGFGDFVTVTAAGRILAVFGMLAGTILNAMPIAVVDASLVTTLQTEEDHKSREVRRKKHLEASIARRSAAGGKAETDRTSDGSFPSFSSYEAALLHDRADESFRAELDGQRRAREEAAAATPQTHAEMLLVHLHLLSQCDVIDMANPPDVVLDVADCLLEASVVNTAAELQQQRRKRKAQWHAGVADLDKNVWKPTPVASIPLWFASTSTNVVREAQVAGLQPDNPTGEVRESITETVLLSRSSRRSLGSALANPKLSTFPSAVSESASADDAINCILDEHLWDCLYRRRSSAIARSLTVGASESADSPNRDSDGTRHQRLELHGILRRHCDVITSCCWGRSVTTLIPRRASPTMFTHEGTEGDTVTVQVLRYFHDAQMWLPLLPYREPSATNDAPLGTAYKFRSRTGHELNAWTPGSALMCTSAEYDALSRQTSISARAITKRTKSLLQALRQIPALGASIAVDASIEAPKPSADASRTRSAKAQREAETRELLEALSSEKKAAFAVLRTLDMSTDGLDISDRLSLLQLATSAADKLDKERQSERRLALQRFATVQRVKSEEQNTRCVLMPHDVVLVFGGSHMCPETTASSIAAALPAQAILKAFAHKRIQEKSQRGVTTASAGATFSPLIGVAPFLGQTLAYVYSE